MRARVFETALLLIVIGSILVSPSLEVFGADYPSEANYDRTYTFDVQFGYYRFSHKLYVSVPPSLYYYYHNKNHAMRGDGDYSKFVTPNVYRSVAESIRNVTADVPNSDEQFANAVLEMVHQVSYVKSNVKYPVETMVESSGDCDVLSLLAASIMKAGGLDVVLLYYKGITPSHMNVGVYLSNAPVYRTWWMAQGSFEYDNKTYWMAECTSLADWKVGDRPEMLAGAKPQVISLENCEKSSPAQVSSGLDNPLNPSSISISVSSENSTSGGNWRTLAISGSISPVYAENRVVVYVNQDGFSSNTFRTTSTDEFGNYSLIWNFTSMGTYHVRASLNGFANYTGSDSDMITVFVEFYRSSVADEMLDYYGGGATAVSPLYRISASQTGKKFLQSNLTGTSILLSGDFIMLSSGRNATTPIEETITVPRLQTFVMPGRRGVVTIWKNEQIVVKREETTKQFGFTLRHDRGNNYTASVKVLNDDDVSLATEQLYLNNTALMNATENTKENAWYKVAAKITQDVVITELYDENGTLLRSLSLQRSAVSSGESGILMTYDKNAVIAFKNLKAEILDQRAPPTANSQSQPASELEPLVPYFGLGILLAVATAAIVYTKDRKKSAITQKTGS